MRLYDAVLRRLGGFVLAQTEPSGAVLAEYDLASGTPVAGKYSICLLIHRQVRHGVATVAIAVAPGAVSWLLIR
jgi:hypothetical protein